MKIAITGATGFLGKRIAQLAHVRGIEVVTTGRNAEAGRKLIQEGIAFAAADITDRAALMRAFAGADVVIHSAALSAPWGAHEDFHRVNVEGTRAVIEATKAAGGGRLIHISTASVYFQLCDQLGLREDASLSLPFNSYADTKRQSEMLVEQSGLTYIILRPRGIFGPGDPSLMPRLIRAAEKRPLPLMRGGAAVTDLTFVDDAAEAALVAAYAQPPALNTTYNICNGEPMRIRDLAEQTLAAAGCKVRWRKVPVAAALVSARLMEGLCARLPGRPEPVVLAYGVGLFAFSQTMDISKAARRLGWRPQTALAEGLERTFRAWQSSPEER